MSRLRKAVQILEAAQRWKQQCLLDGRSLFCREQLWSMECFGELHTYFVERPDVGGDSFEDKLQRQLEPATPQAKRLWAEMTWVYYLIVISVKSTTKLDRIRTVWESSGEELPEDHWALGDVLSQGLISPGRGYASHKWREFKFIIATMLDWFSCSLQDRQGLLADPWRFAEWVDKREEGHRRQFRHALLFLLFPDEFENSMVGDHKRNIIKGLGKEYGGPFDIDTMDTVDLDKTLLKIRNRLQAEHGDEEIDFYISPWKKHWQPDIEAPSEGDPRDEYDFEEWYRDHFGAADVWVIGAGEGARLWGDFQVASIAAIGWDDLGDLGEYESRDAIHQALIESGAGQNPYNNSLAVWEFANEVKIGDILLSKKGRNAILGWGKVTGDYCYDSERPEYQNLRKVEWSSCRKPIIPPNPTTTKTLTRVTNYKNWLWDIFQLIDADKEDAQVTAPETKIRSYDITTALSDLFVGETDFQRILDSIALRKNLILQGPPGVGKTYIARRIAWCLLARQDSSCIEMVQFHQSYAYEDFVQGWRPTETGGFTLRNGTFFEFCTRAQKQPGTDFFFIIDEINRGNMSRIFGELLMLIEADKRGPEHAIVLTYSESGECFSVPENVYLLGLMNTADRSLAIVDYALRRRFAFHTLKPAYGTRKFREYLLEAEVHPDLVDRIEEKLSALNEKICKDKDLGPGYQIGHSYFMPEETADENWYRGIVETQIKPLLLEYWFDHPEKVDRLVEDLLG